MTSPVAIATLAFMSAVGRQEMRRWMILEKHPNGDTVEIGDRRHSALPSCIMPGNRSPVKAAKPRPLPRGGKNDEQSGSCSRTIASTHIERDAAIDAYLIRWLRHRRRHDLPCHRMAPSITFYSRLSPCQPRATLKTKNKRRALPARRLLRARTGPCEAPGRLDSRTQISSIDGEGSGRSLSRLTSREVI